MVACKTLPALPTMSSKTTCFHSMHAYNAHLQEQILCRSHMIQYEIDNLLSLRCSLLSPRSLTRKRKRQDKSDLSQGDSSRVDALVTRSRWNHELLRTLEAEVVKANCKDSMACWDQNRWSRVAEAFRGAGHPPFTPYQLFAKYRDIQQDRNPISLSEAHFICQYVHENGRDWKELCEKLQRLFGYTRSPFQVAQRYRLSSRRAFVENNLTPSQLLTLLRKLPVAPHRRDFSAMSIEARRFASHKTLQISPFYLKRELESIDFASRVPACHQLYWKLVNLLCNFSFTHPNRLDAFQHKMPFCFQQLSLEELSRSLQCSSAELRQKVVQALLSSSRSPDTLDFEECSRKLFGVVYGARLVYQISEEFYTKNS